MPSAREARRRRALAAGAFRLLVRPELFLASAARLERHGQTTLDDLRRAGGA